MTLHVAKKVQESILPRRILTESKDVFLTFILPHAIDPPTVNSPIMVLVTIMRKNLDDK